MKSTGVSKLINLCEYPINQPGKRLSSVINKVRDDLNKDGCAIIRRFLSEKGISELVKEAENVAKGWAKKKYNIFAAPVLKAINKIVDKRIDKNLKRNFDQASGRTTITIE